MERYFDEGILQPVLLYRLFQKRKYGLVGIARRRDLGLRILSWRPERLSPRTGLALVRIRILYNSASTAIFRILLLIENSQKFVLIFIF